MKNLKSALFAAIPASVSPVTINLNSALALIDDAPAFREGYPKCWRIAEGAATCVIEAAGVGDMRAALEGARVLIESFYADAGRDPSNNDTYCKIVDLLAGREVQP